MSGPAPAAPAWRENGGRDGLREPVLAALWRARDLVWFFVLRDLRVRYSQAVLGVVWVLLQPAATVVVFTFVFARLARVGSDGIPYPLFALAGMVVWTYFSGAVSRGSEALVGNPELVTKVSFPRVAAPAAAVLSPLVDLVVSLALLAVLLLVYRRSPGWAVLATPLWLVLVVLAALGTSLWLSALNVRFRDVKQALGPVLQVWLFASPVAYPSSALEGGTALLYALNPMVGVIGLARWSLLGGPWPGWPLAVSSGVVLAVLVSGAAYFRRAQREFADVI
ncbi:ABC transporter permease [Microlunatus flavus]|uniref:Transport permease protein n=1 Tax=Microlunatus flavus TaxID=1036181 RepID=A0A1H9CWQ7_9ACTN|nr:ABC transporter permease [Microlunatus flavus]SEQ05650.1 ABC-2 type transport system permease protein/lipopolysaccharide transport system permease protein [Microlunatus flavus]